jgi:transmembrane 9 superfamily protein 2/4
MRLVACLILLVVGFCDGFYLPGVDSYEFADGEKVELKVNKLTSEKNLVTYDYYKFPFCRPDKVRNAGERLGEYLAGDTIQNSAYEIFMNKSSYCNVLCVPSKDDGQARYQTADETAAWVKLIDREYNVNWIVDNLPAASLDLTEDGMPLYGRGFPVGMREVDWVDGEERPTNNRFLFNHVRIHLKYHTSSEFKGKRIVGFEVAPVSVQHEVVFDSTTNKWSLANCDPSVGILPPAESPVARTRNYITKEGFDDHKPLVAFSYDVEWSYSPVRWASRWDVYLSMGGRTYPTLHWVAIVDSLRIAFFLGGPRGDDHAPRSSP